MREFLIFFIGFNCGACVWLIVLGLCFAARDKKPPKGDRIETLCVTHAAPKGSQDRTVELAHKLGRGLLTCGLIKIDRQEGMEWTIVTGTVRVVVPEKEAEQ